MLITVYYYICQFLLNSIEPLFSRYFNVVKILDNNFYIS